MKIAITVYPDDTYQASIIIEALKGIRGLELDSYSKGGIKDEFLQKPKATPAHTLDQDPESEPVVVHVKQDADGGLYVPDRPDISPGEPSIGKIGGDTKSTLLGILHLNKSADAASFGAKYQEHMKLLWKRNEVKFDGKEYYL